MMATASDPILTAIAQSLEASSRWKAVAFCTSLTSLLLLAVVVKLVFWPAAYIAPAGGPGLVKAGTIDDQTAQDYAARWYRERWNWRPETYKTMQETIVATTHPHSTAKVKADIERDGRVVRELKLSAQTIVLATKVLQRKGQVLTIAIQGRRTLYSGSREERDEAVDAKVLVLPWVANGRPSGLVAIPGPTTPALLAPPS
jgi:hypothetical protein